MPTEMNDIVDPGTTDDPGTTVDPGWDPGQYDSVNVSFKFGTYSSFLQTQRLEDTNTLYDTNAFYNLEDIQALYLDNSAFYTTLFDTTINNPYVLNLNKSDANPYAYTIYPKINELQIGNLSLNSTYLINNINNFQNLYNAPNLQKIAPSRLPLLESVENNEQQEYPSDIEYYPPTKFLYNYSPSSFYVFGTGDYTDTNFNANFNGLLTINYHSYYPVVEILNEEYSLFNKNGQISHTSFYHIQDTGELRLQGSTYMPMQKITQEEYDNLENNNEINPNILYIIIAQE